MGAIRTTEFGKNRSALIFNHIPKCAGSTVNRLMKSLFPCCHYLPSAWDWNRFVKAIEFDARGLVAFCGHMTWGVHEMLPEDVSCYYFTFLRDPLELAASNLSHQVNTGFLREEDYASLQQNIMVQVLAGGDAKLAGERLANDYFHVGFVEHFDESIDTLLHKLVMPDTGYVLRNKSPHKVRLTPEQQAIILKANRDDSALYSHALAQNAFKETTAPGHILGEETHVASDMAREAYRDNDVRKALNAHIAVARSESTPEHERVDAWVSAARLSFAQGIGDGETYLRNAWKQVRETVLYVDRGTVDPELLAALTSEALAELKVSSGLPDSAFNKSVGAMLALASDSLQRLGRDREALKAALEANRISPWNWNFAKKAALLLRAKCPDKSVRTLERLPEHHHRQAEFWYEICTALFMAGGQEAFSAFVVREKKNLEATVFPAQPGAEAFESLPVADAGWGRQTLVFRSAPEIVCHFALGSVESGWLVSHGGYIFSRPPECECLLELDGQIPTGEAILAGTKDRVAAFDSALVPTNGQLPLETYAKFMLPCKALGIENIYFYPMTNIFSSASDAIVFKPKEKP